MLHQSVLLKEAVEGLNIKPNGIYIDGTFGRGGHSREILQHLGAEGILLGIDKDSEAIKYARDHFNDDRFQIMQGSFSQLTEAAKAHHIWGKIDGILLDLGVSSPQLDNPARGFSFLQEGPLDMRMDKEQAFNAEKFINQATAEEMAVIFKEYGEERFARRIARAIVSAREVIPIQTTQRLAEIVRDANPKWERHKHPATRVFQAIRIHINRELLDLTHFLNQVMENLAVGGRLVIISFHSLEDRIVKQFMRQQERGIQIPREIPIRYSHLKTNFKCIGKAIKAKDEEVEQNSRARSAILRIGEKIA